MHEGCPEGPCGRAACSNLPHAEEVMTTAQLKTSEELERIYGITLRKAQQLVTSRTQAAIDAIQDILNETAADRMLATSLKGREIEKGSTIPVGLDHANVTYALVEVANRLSDAIGEIATRIRDDFECSLAGEILRKARAEGRIQ